MHSSWPSALHCLISSSPSLEALREQDDLFFLVTASFRVFWETNFMAQQTRSHNNEKTPHKRYIKTSRKTLSRSQTSASPVLRAKAGKFSSPWRTAKYLAGCTHRAVRASPCSRSVWPTIAHVTAAPDTQGLDPRSRDCSAAVASLALSQR